MGTFTTSDGFEFETTREPGLLRCVCRRGPGTGHIEIAVPPGLGVGPQLLELGEMVAREGCIAEESRRNREERR
mgnify:CR=1 FL=1